jgi:hypothetical protein
MRRPGITLMEVLAAIFITGLGLLSLLTLFPLGALNMAQALQDDRAALAADNGRAIANAVNMRLDFDVQAAMLNLPDQNLNPNAPFTIWAASPSADGPGYVVMVDPIGTLAYAGQIDPNTNANWAQWVAGQRSGVMIPRVRGAWLRPANPLTGLTTADYLRWCSVQDDLVFTNDGAYQGLAADPPAFVSGLGGTVQRNLRYSFAWVCRMPRAGAPNVVDVATLVFNGRSLDLVGFETQEAAYTAQFVPAQNQIILAPNANGSATLRRNQWIMDASMTTDPQTGAPTGVTGFFYRIVGVSEPDNGSVTVEVQTPLRGWGQNGGTGRVVIFSNLVEVFDDGTF